MRCSTCQRRNVPVHRTVHVQNYPDNSNRTHCYLPEHRCIDLIDDARFQTQDCSGDLSEGLLHSVRWFWEMSAIDMYFNMVDALGESIANWARPDGVPIGITTVSEILIKFMILTINSLENVLRLWSVLLSSLYLTNAIGKFEFFRHGHLQNSAQPSQSRSRI